MIKTKNWIKGLKQGNFSGAVGKLIANVVKVVKNEWIREEGQGRHCNSKQQISGKQNREK